MRASMAIVGLVAAVAASAFGVPKPRQVAAKPAVARPAAAVKLENNRRVALLSFEIVMLGKDKAPETIVGRLEKPLVSGASASFPLTGARGCAFEARWAFEDLKESGDVDLCNDAHIVLVD